MILLLILVLVVSYWRLRIDSVRAEISVDKALERGSYDKDMYLRVLLSECFDDESVLDREKAVSRYESWVYGEVEDEISRSLFRQGYNIHEWRLKHKKEYRDMIKVGIAKRVERFERYLEDKTYFVDIEVSDQNGSFYSDLEHEIVPNLDCCVAMRSWH